MTFLSNNTQNSCKQMKLSGCGRRVQQGSQTAPTVQAQAYGRGQSPTLTAGSIHSFFLEHLLPRLQTTETERPPVRETLCVGEVNRSLAGVRAGPPSKEPCSAADISGEC